MPTQFAKRILHLLLRFGLAGTLFLPFHNEKASKAAFSMGSDLLLSEILRALKKNLRSYGIGASHLPVVRSIRDLAGRTAGCKHRKTMTRRQWCHRARRNKPGSPAVFPLMSS